MPHLYPRWGSKVWSGRSDLSGGIAFCPPFSCCLLFFCVCPCLLPWAPLFLLFRSRNLPLPGSDGPGHCHVCRGSCLQHHRPSWGGAADLPRGLPPEHLRGPGHLEPLCPSRMEPGRQWYNSSSSYPTLLWDLAHHFLLTGLISAPFLPGSWCTPSPAPQEPEEAK